MWDVIETTLRHHRLSLTHTHFVRVGLTAWELLPDRKAAICAMKYLIRFYAVPMQPPHWRPIEIL